MYPPLKSLDPKPCIILYITPFKELSSCDPQVLIVGYSYGSIIGAAAAVGCPGGWDNEKDNGSYYSGFRA